MNRILLFCALGVLLGCRPTAEPSGGVITLSYVASEQSKTDALTAGDEVAVFARVEGTESYFLEYEKFVTGSDGRTLSKSPVAYYPETKQAVNFYAYFPYHTGAFSVPSDQSTVAALKKADLCWASAKSTPVSVVPLEFRHLFSRLVVTTSEPTAKITCSVVPSGVLNAATAEFVLKSNKEEVSTTGNELILPAQPLNRLILTVSGVVYVFDQNILLEAGKTTTLNLTLNASTQTATLNGSSTTDWTASATQGTPTEAVSNILTLHWANYVPQGATPDKIIMTIGGTDYTVSSGITYANKTFTVPFASNQLRYPYTISKITFYNGSTQSLPSCTQLLGPTIYKSAAQTLGIKDPTPNAVLINGLWWATGDLVATGDQGANKQGGCNIGLPTDGGLYFQFGSLIGWKGGSSTNRGNGEGKCDQQNNTYWGGSTSFNWANEVYIWPVEMMNNPTTWPTQATNQWYFGLQSGWSTAGQDIRTYPNLISGALAHLGIGDPCSYYLGGSWRLPTITECAILTGLASYGPYYSWGTAGITTKYVYDSDTFDGISMKGAWFGPGIRQSSIPSLKSALFFNAYSGYRFPNNGMLTNLGTGRYLSPTTNIVNSTESYQPYYNWDNGVAPQGGYDRRRSYGFTVRCVQPV